MRRDCVANTNFTIKRSTKCKKLATNHDATGGVHGGGELLTRTKGPSYKVDMLIIAQSQTHYPQKKYPKGVMNSVLIRIDIKELSN